MAGFRWLFFERFAHRPSVSIPIGFLAGWIGSLLGSPSADADA